MEVLKDRGAGGFASIKDELTRLEAEDKSLSAALKQVTDRQQPLDAKSTAAATFLSTWIGVGDLLDDVSDGEKQQILQHYIEVIEFRETDPIRKVGVYALQLFPEVRQYFDTDRGEGDVEASSPPKPPKTPNGATFLAEGSPFALNEAEAAVCSGCSVPPFVFFGGRCGASVPGLALPWIPGWFFLSHSGVSLWDSYATAWHKT